MPPCKCFIRFHLENNKFHNFFVFTSVITANLTCLNWNRETSFRRGQRRKTYISSIRHSFPHWELFNKKQKPKNNCYPNPYLRFKSVPGTHLWLFSIVYVVLMRSHLGNWLKSKQEEVMFGTLGIVMQLKIFEADPCSRGFGDSSINHLSVGFRWVATGRWYKSHIFILTEIVISQL